MVGTEVSHYRILEQLGAGGMGVVYRAIDQRLDRAVALKFLSPYLTTDPEARERFIREAKAASALQHDNICTVHEIDQASDGRLFIVMDCYRGKTLKKRLEEGPLETDEIVTIARQIAAGLSRAHEHGIVHRDIKSENLFLTDDGVVKILDFGLAKLGNASLTRSDASLKGTVAYMSPEQIAGEPTDSATDVWSFGVVLFEMLTRSLPFQGEHPPAVMYAILNENPPAVSAYRPDAPPALARLCSHCLTRDRRGRPRSMALIAEALKDVPPRSVRTSTIRPWIIPAAVIVVAGIFLLVFRSPRPTQVPPTPSATLAVLPVKDLTHDSSASDWPEVLQALVVSDLTGIEGLRVYDPTGPNTVDRGLENHGAVLAGFHGPSHLPSVDVAVEGSILLEGATYILRLNVRSWVTEEVLSSEIGTVRSEPELVRLADSLSLVVVEVLRAHGILPGEPNHLQPWWPQHFQSIFAMKAFTQACRFALAGEQQESEAALRRAIAYDPAFVTPRVWLVTRLVSRGDTDEAAANVRILQAQRDSTSPFDRESIAWAEASLHGDLAAQATALNRALEYSPGNAILLYSLGRVEYLRGNYRGCTDLLQPVADRRWEFPSLYLLLVQGYDMQEEYGLEKSALDAAFSLRHPPRQAHLYMATILRRGGDTVSALQEERRFIDASTKQGESLRAIYTALSNSNITEGFLAEGIAYYRQGARSTHERSVTHLEHAETFCRQGDTLRAIVELARAIAVDSSAASAHFRLAEILESLREPQKAMEYYRKYLAVDSTGPNAGAARLRLAALHR
jgi:serine/threonine protein kinase/tetratricopeptide (TPR) repeat protein